MESRDLVAAYLLLLAKFKGNSHSMQHPRCPPSALVSQALAQLLPAPLTPRPRPPSRTRRYYYKIQRKLSFRATPALPPERPGQSSSRAAAARAAHAPPPAAFAHSARQRSMSKALPRWTATAIRARL